VCGVRSGRIALENGHDVNVCEIDCDFLAIFDGEAGLVYNERFTHEILCDSGDKIAIVFPERSRIVLVEIMDRRNGQAIAG
jgi:hypothetical protein